VQLFGVRKAPLNRFLPPLADPLSPFFIPMLYDLFLLFLPDVAGDHFGAVAALCAFLQAGTFPAEVRVGFVFAVSGTAGCAVLKRLCSGYG
jgi:hypothetical protein